jgi:Protein of unknown function (DUF2723)
VRARLTRHCRTQLAAARGERGRHVRNRTLAQWLAGAVPWIAYVLSSSGHGYWLDSGEFVAAAVRLDISHPPGHPLTELYGKAFTLLPLGSLPLRVAIGQAFATALACVFACRATGAVLKLQGVPEAVRWPCAVFAAWLSAFTYGLWFQAVRPEVYALQTLCSSVILERVASFLERERDSQTDGSRFHAARYAGPACFALGLGLANHHFTALFLVPAMLVPAFRLARSGRLRCLGGAALLGLLGLATYAYLPLRAAGALPANLGHPDDWSRFVWVVSARVYQHGAATQTTQPFAERLADVVVLLLESFRALPLLAATVGLYVLLRIRGSRAAGIFLLLWVLPILGARAWLGPVRSNPDVLGYFGPALLGVGVLASAALAELATQLTAFARLVLARGVDLAPWSRNLTWVLPVLALFNLTYALERSTLAGFHATDSIDDQRIRSLPPRAVVVETMPQTVFRHWELDAVERIRPDVAQVPVPFLTHPGMRDALIQRSPPLRRLIDGYLVSQMVRCVDLAEEAKSRTTWLELDPKISPKCYPGLAPAHLLHRVTAGAPQPAAAERRERLEGTYAKLYADLGPAELEEPETLRQLLSIHYLDAVAFAAVGERKLAREEIARARLLAPHDSNVIALSAALAAQGEGALAVGPFLDL